MKPEILARLSDLPALTAARAREQSLCCKVCGATALPFDVVDFNKACSTRPYQFGLSGITVPYHRCVDCGFIFTAFFDDWSGEEFARFVYNDDYVKADPDYVEGRPKRCAADMAHFLNGAKPNVLDYGSGAGIFAEELASISGARTTPYDPFSSPTRPTDRYDLISCFEVIEHSTRPVETMTDMASFLDKDGLLVIGTSTQPVDIDTIRANWWYIAPRNGHVSIFTKDALAILAQRAGLILHTTPKWFGFAFPGSSPRLLNDSRRVKTVVLKAPANSGDDEWHGIERNGFMPFRWSRSGVLRWQVDPGADVLRIIIRFEMQAAPRFADQCAVICQGKAFPVSVSGKHILAEIPVGPNFDGNIELLTPALRSPSEDGRSQDRRLLGIAIAA